MAGFQQGPFARLSVHRMSRVMEDVFEFQPRLDDVDTLSAIGQMLPVSTESTRILTLGRPFW